MNESLQNKLYSDYSELFANNLKSPAQSCMSYGIECGNGWYDLIRSVCYRIAQHERNKKYHDERKLKKDPSYQPEYRPVAFDQIKEKYGGLRIYYNGGDDYVDGVVDMAEEMSFKICERCGNKGTPTKGGWITTLCDFCRQEDTI